VIETRIETHSDSVVEFRAMANPTQIQLITLLPGLAMLVVSVFLYRSTRKFLASSKTASGTILADKQGSLSSRPRFTFMTEDGTQIAAQATTATKAHTFRKGQTVRVLYDPARPQRATIDTFIQLWLAPAICAGLGLSFSVISFFIN